MAEKGWKKYVKVKVITETDSIEDLVLELDHDESNSNEKFPSFIIPDLFVEDEFSQKIENAAEIVHLGGGLEKEPNEKDEILEFQADPEENKVEEPQLLPAAQASPEVFDI